MTLDLVALKKVPQIFSVIIVGFYFKFHDKVI